MSSSGTSRQARNIAVRGRVRTDAQRVEEVGDGADEEVQRGRLHRLVRAVAAGGAPGASDDEPADEEDDGQGDHRGDQKGLGVQWASGAAVYPGPDAASDAKGRGAGTGEPGPGKRSTHDTLCGVRRGGTRHALVASTVATRVPRPWSPLPSRERLAVRRPSAKRSADELVARRREW